MFSSMQKAAKMVDKQVLFKDLLAYLKSDDLLNASNVIATLQANSNTVPNGQTQTELVPDKVYELIDMYLLEVRRGKWVLKDKGRVVEQYENRDLELGKNITEIQALWQKHSEKLALMRLAIGIFYPQSLNDEFLAELYKKEVQRRKQYFCADDSDDSDDEDEKSWRTNSQVSTKSGKLLYSIQQSCASDTSFWQKTKREALKSQSKLAIGKIEVGKLKKAQAVLSEKLQDRGKLSNSVNSGKKEFVAMFRGVNYMTDRWFNPARRAHYKSDDVGKALFPESVLKQTLPKYFFTDAAASSEELSALSECANKLRNFYKGLRHNGKCVAVTAKPGKKLFLFNSITDYFQHEFSNGINQHLLHIKKILTPNDLDRSEEEHIRTRQSMKWCDGFMNAFNYAVANGCRPYHSLKYAIGLKDYYEFPFEPHYDSDGKLHNSHAGKLYIILYDKQELIKDNTINRVTTKNHNGQLPLERDVAAEYEITPIFVPENHVVAQLHIKFPSFHKEYKQIYAMKYGLDANLYCLFQQLIKGTEPETEERKAVISLLKEWLCAYLEVLAITIAQQEAQKQGGHVVYIDYNDKSTYTPEKRALNSGKKNLYERNKLHVLEELRRQLGKELLAEQMRQYKFVSDSASDASAQSGSDITIKYKFINTTNEMDKTVLQLTVPWMKEPLRIAMEELSLKFTAHSYDEACVVYKALCNCDCNSEGGTALKRKLSIVFGGRVINKGDEDKEWLYNLGKVYELLHDCGIEKMTERKRKCYMFLKICCANPVANKHFKFSDKNKKKFAATLLKQISSCSVVNKETYKKIECLLEFHKIKLPVTVDLNRLSNIERQHVLIHLFEEASGCNCKVYSKEVVSMGNHCCCICKFCGNVICQLWQISGHIQLVTEPVVTQALFKVLNNDRILGKISSKAVVVKRDLWLMPFYGATISDAKMLEKALSRAKEKKRRGKILVLKQNDKFYVLDLENKTLVSLHSDDDVCVLSQELQKRFLSGKRGVSLEGKEVQDDDYNLIISRLGYVFDLSDVKTAVVDNVPGSEADRQLEETKDIIRSNIETLCCEIHQTPIEDLFERWQKAKSYHSTIKRPELIQKLCEVVEEENLPAIRPLITCVPWLHEKYNKMTTQSHESTNEQREQIKELIFRNACELDLDITEITQKTKAMLLKWTLQYYVAHKDLSEDEATTLIMPWINKDTVDPDINADNDVFYFNGEAIEDDDDDEEDIDEENEEECDDGPADTIGYSPLIFLVTRMQSPHLAIVKEMIKRGHEELTKEVMPITCCSDGYVQPGNSLRTQSKKCDNTYACTLDDFFQDMYGHNRKRKTEEHYVDVPETRQQGTKLQKVHSAGGKSHGVATSLLEKKLHFFGHKTTEEKAVKTKNSSQQNCPL